MPRASSTLLAVVAATAIAVSGVNAVPAVVVRMVKSESSSAKRGMVALRTFHEVDADPAVISAAALVQAATLAGEEVIATAVYRNTINQTGWGLLDVVGNASFPDEQVAWAAGFAEGAATVDIIYDYIMNVGAQKDLGPQLDAFLAANREYIEGQVATNPTDSYWHNVALVYNQLDGINAGYEEHALPEQQIPAFAILNANLAGDLYDLIPAIGGDKKHPMLRRFRSREAEGTDEDAPILSHCSALFRVLPDGSDILAAHTTWSSLESMVRLYRYMSLPFSMTGAPGDNSVVPGARMAYSGYPATISSVDDHYVISSGLVAIETTIGNNNPSLWQYVIPQSVLEWHRSVVANRLSHSAPEWMTIFSMQPSGTYNNEWMVLDAKLFTPGQPLQDNTLWVLDQMPGNIQANDNTDYLRQQGYWSSYNVPSFPAIFNVSGQQALVDKYGPFYSWAGTARANIFRRDAPNVTDLESMQRMMRYNDFKNDPLSTQGCGSNPPSSAIMTISARMDLNQAQGDYKIPGIGFGDLAGIDSKIASAVAVKAAAGTGGGPTGTLSVYTQCGPTHDIQPAFSWSNTSLTGLRHGSQPVTWDFPWISLTWPAP